MMIQQPDFAKGRERSNQIIKLTKQVVPYSSIDCRALLDQLLLKEEAELLPESLA